MRSIVLILLALTVVNCDSSSHSKEKKTQIQKTISQKENTIFLVYQKEINSKHIEILKEHLEKAFPEYEIELHKAPALPKELRSTMHKERYRADSILRFLNLTYLDHALKVILITDKGITCTKYTTTGGVKKIKEPRYRYIDWGIFGLGACPGYTCVVSTKFLWARKANEKIFLQRLKNIAVHELGHTFGLPHCSVEKCVMNDANETIVTIDKSTGLFCAKCKYNLPL